MYPYKNLVKDKLLGSPIGLTIWTRTDFGNTDFAHKFTHPIGQKSKNVKNAPNIFIEKVRHTMAGCNHHLHIHKTRQKIFVSTVYDQRVSRSLAKF